MSPTKRYNQKEQTCVHAQAMEMFNAWQKKREEELRNATSRAFFRGAADVFNVSHLFTPTTLPKQSDLVARAWRNVGREMYNVLGIYERTLRGENQ